MAYLDLTLCIYIFILCFLLAKLEIHIEGKNGWASILPTWRIDNPKIIWINGGKIITGYHTYLILLLIAFFHFPLLFTEFSIFKEAKILYSFFICTSVWDYLWFVLNPHYGLKKYNKENIWWFKRWFLGFPIDYYYSLILSLSAFLLPSFLKASSYKERIIIWGINTSALIILSAVLTIVTELILRRKRKITLV